MGEEVRLVVGSSLGGDVPLGRVKWRAGEGIESRRPCDFHVRDVGCRVLHVQVLTRYLCAFISHSPILVFTCNACNIFVCEFDLCPLLFIAL